MLSISLGPLALPVAPLLLVVASVVASIVADQVARGAPPPQPPGTQDSPRRPGHCQHQGRPRPAPAETTPRAGDVVTWAVMVGLLAARLGHLALNAQAYAASPGSVFDIRDGGWHLTSGLAGGLAWLLWQGLACARTAAPPGRGRHGRAAAVGRRTGAAAARRAHRLPGRHPGATG